MGLALRTGPLALDDAVTLVAEALGIHDAAPVAEHLRLPLDGLAVRKVGHPCQPEYAIGAVTPDGGVYLREDLGLSEWDVTGAARERFRT